MLVDEQLYLAFTQFYTAILELVLKKLEIVMKPMQVTSWSVEMIVTEYINGSEFISEFP